MHAAVDLGPLWGVGGTWRGKHEMMKRRPVEDRIVRMYHRPWNTRAYGWIPHLSGFSDPTSLKCRVKRVPFWVP